MYPVSAAFLDAVSGSHTVTAGCELWEGGVKVADLPIAGGQVTIDVNRAVRRMLSLPVPDPEYVDLLVGNPWAKELRPYRGVKYDDGSTENVPLGVFIYDDVDLDDAGDGFDLTIEAFDRSERVRRNKWIDPYKISKLTNVEFAIDALLEDRYPDAAGTLVGTGSYDTLDSQVITDAGDQSDPWADAIRIAASSGFDLAYDGLGRPVLREMPDPADATAAWSLVEGSDSTLIQVGRSVSAAEVYNGVVYSGEGSGITAPVRYVAWDTNTNSPTYYLGPMGQKPKFVSSPLIGTTSKAKKAAEAELFKSLGRSEAVTFTSLVNPALDGFDAVQVTRSRIGVSSVYLLDQITIPLSPGEMMSAVARVKQEVSYG